MNLLIKKSTVIDEDWIKLLVKAKQLGLTTDDIRKFIQHNKDMASVK